MISINCFKGLPIEYESFLVERYESFTTTCRYFEIFSPKSDYNYLLIYNDGNLIDLVLFENIGNTTVCRNSLVSLNQNIVAEFAKYIFEKFPAIKKIKIEASYTDYSLSKSTLSLKSEDFILQLPATMDNYYSELGRSTRQHMKSYKSRLQKDYSGVSFITKFGNEIEIETVRRVIQLNFDRMKHKGLIPNRDQSHTHDIHRYAQHYGCVSYIEIDGQLVAGCITLLLNKRAFLYIIAHDNHFSKYNPGQLCLINIIQTCIDKDISTIHFLWGELEYKTRFLGKPHPTYSYVIHKTYSLNYWKGKVNGTISENLFSLKKSKYAKSLAIKLKKILKRTNSIRVENKNSHKPSI